MVVIILEKCPLALRGDLTKWLQEVSLGVYVGRVSARVRENLWTRVCEQSKTGRATMVYSTRNEQRFDFRVHNTVWEPIDFDGIKLMLKPSPARSQQLAQKRGSFSKRHAYVRASRKRSQGKLFEPSEYVVIDVETTGLDPEHDEIIEIGALRVLGGEVAETFQAFVRATKDIPLAVTELTGIDAETLAGEGVELKKAIRRFLRFVDCAPVVSHNAVFDRDFIQAACDECDEGLFNNECIDTLTLSRERVKGVSDYRLSALVQHLDIDINEFHRSIPDCKATRELFLKLIEMQ